MSLHMGQHWYVLCDHRDGDVPCRALVLPDAQSDPVSFGAVIAGRASVYAAAKAAGWQISPHPDGFAADWWLCPAHRTRKEAT